MLLLIGLLLLFLGLLQSVFERCEYVRVCQERCSPCNLVGGSTRESFCLMVAKVRRVGIQVGYVWVSKELPVGAPEYALGLGCDVDGGDLLPSLSSACGGGGEECFSEIILSGQHSIGRRIIYRDDEVRVLGRAVLLGVRDDL